MTAPARSPTRGTGPDAIRRPWLPASLKGRGFTEDTVERLSYVVVEELLLDGPESLTTLTITPWPAADGLGRVRFDVDVVEELTMLTEDLDAQLYEGWRPHGPQIGDVFATEIDHDTFADATGQVWQGPLEQLLPEKIYDVTDDARLVARLALYGAHTDLLDPGTVSRNELRDTVVAPRRKAPERDLNERPRRRH
jgi:hypothetical protein